MAYTTATVNGWYQAVQFQNGPTATVSTWVNALNAGQLTPAQVQNSIITQDAYTLGVVNPVLRLYQSSFNSVPDQAGQAYWVGQFGTGAQTYQQIANGFAVSTQFKGIYGNTTATQLANQAQVTLLYQNILQRLPDAAGLAYWMTQPIGVALAGISSSPEMVTVSSLPIQNYQTAEIAGTAAGSGSLYNYPGFPTITYTLTTGIDTATANTFIGNIDGVANTLNSGDTLTGAGTGLNNSLQLTVSADGSAIVPLVTNVQTLQVRSTNAAAQAYAGYTGLTTLTNTSSIANVNFASAIGTANTINILNATSGTVGTTVTYTNNTFNSTSATVNLNLSSVGSSTVSQSFQALVGGTDVVKTLAIKGTGVNAITLTDNAAGIDRTLTTLNLSGTGSIKITGDTNSLANVTTINASTNTGGVNVDLATGGNTKNVAFTGGAGNDRISFAAGAFTIGDTLIGGGGTNTLAIADQTVSTAGNSALITAIGAATGFSVLELTGTATTGTTLQAANTGLSNFSFTGAFTAAAVAATDGIAAYAVTGEANSQAFTIKGAITGAAGGAAAANTNGQAGGAGISFTPTLDNGSNSLSLTLNGTTLTGGIGTVKAGNGTADGAGGAGLSATTFETVNIVSSGTSANAFVGGAAGGTLGTPAAGFGIGVNSNATINVTGSQDLNLGTVGGTNVNINASGFTGSLTAAVANGNQTVTGGTGNDTIIAINNGTVTIDVGAGNDRVNVTGAGVVVKSDATIAAQTGGLAGAANHAGTITLGAGTDTVAFYGSTLANTMTSSAGTTAVVTIADFTTGVDKIGLVNQAAAFTSMTLATAQTIATAADLTAVYAGITAIGASTNGGAASGVLVTVSGGAAAGAYLYVNDATGGVSNTADMLIKLTGVTSLATTDFVFA